MGGRSGWAEYWHRTDAWVKSLADENLKKRVEEGGFFSFFSKTTKQHGYSCFSTELWHLRAAVGVGG